MFSDLSKAGLDRKFVQVFTKEYPWIQDLNVEVHAGSPAVFATLKGSRRKMPVANVSSGVNRVLGMLLVITSRPKAIVLVDEIESGIFYTHFESVWRAILGMLREYDSQMFVSTHSHECLEALARAAGPKTGDISLWRTQRTKDAYKIQQFEGEALRLGIEYGEEIR
jgi:predicted ATPase